MQCATVSLLSRVGLQLAAFEVAEHGNLQLAKLGAWDYLHTKHFSMATKRLGPNQISWLCRGYSVHFLSRSFVVFILAIVKQWTSRRA